jgi:hypothetical protein
MQIYGCKANKQQNTKIRKWLAKPINSIDIIKQRSKLLFHVFYLITLKYFVHINVVYLTETVARFIRVLLFA